MASRELAVGFKEAGADYLVAIEKLGLRPEALFWAYDHTISGFVLVLITEVFDYAGPFELSKVLVRAFNASATPKEIDPFVVRLHSPRHAIVFEIAQFLPFKSGPFKVWDSQGRLKTNNGGVALEMDVNAKDLEINSKWVYRFDLKPKRSATTEIARRWRRFEQTVDQLAA